MAWSSLSLYFSTPGPDVHGDIKLVVDKDSFAVSVPASLKSALPLSTRAQAVPDALLTKFFCAIHLAGAAGELFDAHLQKSEQFFTSAWKAEKTLKSETGQVPTDEAADKAADKAARQSVNKWKNEVKHMNDGSQTVTIDPEFAAECLIEKALVSFYKLKLRKSPAILKFEDHQNRKSQGDKDERRPRAQGRDL